MKSIAKHAIIVGLLLFAISLLPQAPAEEPDWTDRVRDIEDLLEALQRQAEAIDNRFVGTILLVSSDLSEEELSDRNLLLCNGRELPSVGKYSRLAETLGNTWGKAKEGHFKLPDLRGEFIRCHDMGRGVDRGRKLGIFQAWRTGLPRNRRLRIKKHEDKHVIEEGGKHRHKTDEKNHTHPVNDPGHVHYFFNDILANTGGGGFNGPHFNWMHVNRGTTGHGGAEDGKKRHTRKRHTGIGLAPTKHGHNTSFDMHSHSWWCKHEHEVLGGDSETRPRNQALVAVIQY